jgi:hypothetical protein
MDDARPTTDDANMPAQVVRSALLIQRLAGPVLALGALTLYLRTLAPSLGGTVDSAEFQQATYSLSIVHPTGYPLYLVLGRLWISIFPFGDPAFRINLLSALFGAAAVWVLYLTVLNITGSAAGGAAGAGLFAVQAIPWAQASVAEINTLNTLLTGLAFLAFLLWSQGKLALPVAALAYGLAMSHHRTALLYAPVLLAYGIFALRRGTPRPLSPRQLALAMLLLVLPFVAYIYLPLRAHTVDWYTNDWQGFWSMVLGESALPVIQGALGRPFLPRLQSLIFSQIFPGAAGLALLVLGLAGLFLILDFGFWIDHSKVQNPKSKMIKLALLAYAAAFLLGVLFAGFYDILDVSDYLGVPIFMWCVLVGAGVAGILDLGFWNVRSKIQNPKCKIPQVAKWGTLAAVAALMAFTGYRSLHRPDLRVDFSDEDRKTYWAGIKSQARDLPAGTVLVGDWPEYNEARYIQAVEGWRPELRLAVVDALLAGDGRQIDRWLLEEKRPVYLLGEHISILLSRYTAERRGYLWELTGVRTAGPDTAPPPMAHELDRRYGDNITLLGYTLEPDPAVIEAGGLLKLTLYWKATARVQERYVVFNHVIDAQGAKIGQLDGEPGQGFRPTVLWKPGEVVADTYVIGINPGSSRGSYRLMSGLYTRLGQRRLAAFSAEGASLGDYPELAQVEVR